MKPYYKTADETKAAWIALHSLIAEVNRRFDAEAANPEHDYAAQRELHQIRLVLLERQSRLFTHLRRLRERDVLRALRKASSGALYIHLTAKEEE